MNSRSKTRFLMPASFVVLVLFALTVFASAQQKPKTSSPPPKAAAPAHSSAPKSSAPAQHPGGGAGGGAQHPGGAASANRSTGANGPNRSMGPNANARSAGSANGTAHSNTQMGNRSNTGTTNRSATGNAATRGNTTNHGATANTGNRSATGNTANHGNAGANGRGNTGAAASMHHQPAGSKTVALKSGGQATFRKDGHVRTIQTHGMTINHGMHGERHIVASHNGRQVVVTGRHGGYSQRAYYRHGGHAYVQRTYYRDGHYYAYGYRSYYYGGRPYYGYAPAYYYGPAYYGWAYNPWPAPVYYNWGWAGQPWYGYYGPYYQPYPVYPYAALWLTDYLIAANLRAAYEAQAAASGELHPPLLADDSNLIASAWSSDLLVAAHDPGYLLAAALPSGTASTAMSAEVKQAISDQMKKEIASEKDAAANKDKDSSGGGQEVPAALDPNIRYFVVSSDLDVTASDGNECSLTPGDVVYRSGDKPDDDNMVDAQVKAGKKDGCAVGAQVSVSTDDLQEMHNNLRQTMDEGLKKLAENNGKDGLPAAPDTKTTTGEVPAPSPDTNVADDLQAAQKDADQAEAEVQQPN